VALLKELFVPIKSFDKEIVRQEALGPFVIQERLETIVTDRGLVQIKISGSFFVEDGQIVEWFELVEPRG